MGQTVVTGNVRPVAEIKISVFGLDRHIRWDIGAFGEDHDARAELVRLSLQRAGTAADVEGAHTNGVRVIAVASGGSDETALRDAGAERYSPTFATPISSSNSCAVAISETADERARR